MNAVESGPPSAAVHLHASASPDGDDRAPIGDSGDDVSQLFRPLHTWLSASAGRRLATGAAVLIVAQFVFRLWLALSGWFVGDDFAFIGRSYEYPLFSGKFLFLSYASHFMPGSFALVWVTSHLAPYNFLLPTLIDAVLQVGIGVLVYRLLVALFGRRPVILAPLAVFLFSAMTLPAFVWWAAALNQVPQQLAIVAALLNHVRYLKTGNTWRAVAAAGCVAGGLAFSEKTLLIIPFIAALTVLYFVGGPPVRRVALAWRRHWKAWTAYLSVALPYGAFYALAVPSPAHTGANSGGVSQLVGYQFFHAVIPGLLGGPWHWVPLGTNAALADPNDLQVYLALFVFAALIAVSVSMHHRAVFGWSLLLGYASVNVALLAGSRAAIVGPLLGNEYRYATDLCLIGVLCISLSLISLERDFAHAHPQSLLPRASFTANVARWKRAQVIEALPHIRVRTVVTAAVALIVVGGLFSSVGYQKIFGPNSARPFLSRASAAARALPKDASVSDTPVPADAVWGMVYPYTLPSRLLRPDGLTVNIFKSGQSTSNLVVLDSDGTFRRARLDGLTAVPGPDQTCGYHLAAAPVTVPLPSQTIVPWDWIVRVGYISSAATDTTITAAGQSVKVHLVKGLGVVFVLVSGSVDSVGIGALSNGASACTNDVQVGTASAIPGSTP